MAILANQKVLTLDYWKLANKIQPGDYLFDRNGKPVRVKLVQQYFSEDCYEVMLNDYLTISGDKRLEFLVENFKYRLRAMTYKGYHPFRRPLKPMNVENLIEQGYKREDNHRIYSIPTTKPIELPHQTLPVPPFVFGFWFINRKPSKFFTTTPSTQEEVERQLKEFGYKVKIRKTIHNGWRQFTISPSIESQLAPGIPTKIPANYLLADKEQRIELLRGILFAKPRQYSPRRDLFRFSSTHYGTALSIQGLVESLGGKTNLAFTEKNSTYTLTFKIRLKLVPNQVSKPIKIHQARRYIEKITKIQPQTCVHIETDGPDNSYLVGEGFISCR
jgi:hypothetical protein